jgi:hypothetical protein
MASPVPTKKGRVEFEFEFAPVDEDDIHSVDSDSASSTETDRLEAWRDAKHRVYVKQLEEMQSQFQEMHHPLIELLNGNDTTHFAPKPSVCSCIKTKDPKFVGLGHVLLEASRSLKGAYGPETLVVDHIAFQNPSFAADFFEYAVRTCGVLSIGHIALNSNDRQSIMNRVRDISFSARRMRHAIFYFCGSKTDHGSLYLLSALIKVLPSVEIRVEPSAQCGKTCRVLGNVSDALEVHAHHSQLQHLEIKFSPMETQLMVMATRFGHLKTLDLHDFFVELLSYVPQIVHNCSDSLETVKLHINGAVYDQEYSARLFGRVFDEIQYCEKLTTLHIHTATQHWDDGWLVFPMKTLYLRFASFRLESVLGMIKKQKGWVQLVGQMDFSADKIKPQIIKAHWICPTLRFKLFPEVYDQVHQRFTVHEEWVFFSETKMAELKRLACYAFSDPIVSVLDGDNAFMESVVSVDVAM